MRNAQDLLVPGQKCTFGIIKAAQATAAPGSAVSNGRTF